jgi:hypothetical protein
VTLPVSLAEAVEALQGDPTRTVCAQIGDLTVELRAVSDSPASVALTAVEVLRGIGCWEGETYEELVALFAGIRQRPAP